ncbi:MAG: rRNA (guanine966-N2)-methyltransferase [Thermoanaerobaculia bacterium]|jgi:16S rRNA (guanine(966)-N(2))-methyltransferase RsmD|nr:rRNA (guanine966-N2)-methyltransferase [Thermoanaerobaculia bacterium]
MAFFNIAGARIDGARFLDLFAGSGAFSFEAVSRGAASATAIEIDRKSVATIAGLAEDWDVPVTAIASDVFLGIPRLGITVSPGALFDVVYADPPYSFGRYDELLAAIDSRVPLADGALVGIEHPRHSDPLTIECKRLKAVRRAEYGEVWITLFEVT